MAITGANDHIGSAGLTNRNKRLVEKFQNFQRRGEKNIGGQHLGETRCRIKKFYNCCSQRATHQFSF